jgi:hypothetical protein
MPQMDIEKLILSWKRWKLGERELDKLEKGVL